MQRHWKAILVGLILAVAAFIVSVMVGSYMATYAVAVSAMVFALAYLIAVATFKGRSDPEGRGVGGGGH